MGRMAKARKARVTLFLGSGFSAGLGLPTTAAVRKGLLDTCGSTPDEQLQEEFVTKVIGAFWRDVFGWDGCATHPSLEDHFTALDFAANTGHCLGRNYNAKMLRAIRRMAIHRVFELVRKDATRDADVDQFFQELAAAADVTIVTTNWDLVVERCLNRLRIHSNHGTGLYQESGTPLESGPSRDAVMILKLHGSLHFGYCDCCRALVNIQGLYGDLKLYLDPDDMRLFPLFDGDKIAATLPPEYLRTCFTCGRPWSGGRLATFSYRKDLAPAFLQKTWDEVFHRLRIADRWLITGYSLPEADIEVRQLLKTAQLAGEPHKPIDVVTLRDDAKQRYQEFFGTALGAVDERGIIAWARDAARGYVRAAAG
jgi:hypothetical protein